jgi:hypothetical protein
MPIISPECCKHCLKKETMVRIKDRDIKDSMGNVIMAVYRCRWCLKHTIVQSD